MTNPEVDYHLEFSVPFLNLSRDLVTLLRELGLSAKQARRAGGYVVYFKESESIEDCLTLMGATSAALELMGVKMVKDIRNNINRVTNCESANIDKTVAAAAVQSEALRKIERTVGLDALPEELREIAYLRLENPELSCGSWGRRSTGRSPVRGLTTGCGGSWNSQKSCNTIWEDTNHQAPRDQAARKFGPVRGFSLRISRLKRLWRCSVESTGPIETWFWKIGERFSRQAANSDSGRWEPYFQ